MSIFLDPDDVAILTGKKLKAGQIDALRRMGIAFFVNPSGRPVASKSSIEGKDQAEEPKSTWKPSVLNSHEGSLQPI